MKKTPQIILAISLFALLILGDSFFPSPSQVHAAGSVTQNWNFSHSSDFTFDTNLVEVTGGVIQLKPYLGQEWRQVGSSSTNFENVPDIFSLGIDPQGNVFVGTRDETNGNVDVFRSTDNGLTWSKIADGANDLVSGFGPPSAITRIISDNNNPANVYFLAFRGGLQSFDLYRYNSSETPSINVLRDSQNNFDNNVDYSDIAADSSNNLYFLNADNVYKSTDRGATWTKVGNKTTNFSNNSTLAALRIDSSNRIYVVSENGSVFRSTDSGSSWTIQSTGQWSTSVTWDPMSVAFDSSSNVYVVVENIIYRSIDGGVSWSSFATGASEFGGASSINQIHFDTSGNIYVNTGDLWKSIDSGSSWTRVATASGNFGGSSALVSAIYSNTFFYIGTFGSQGNVYRSSLYSTTNPTVVSDFAYSYSTISSLIAAEASGSAGTIKFQISHNGSDWYYFDGSSWTSATSYSQSNTASEVNTNLSTFVSGVGVGRLFFRSYLNSNGSQQPKLDNIAVSVEQPDFYVDPTNGSNSNNGRSQSSAWKTLTYALTQVGSSDTIYALSGTYNALSGETFPLSIPFNLTLRGAGYTSSIIQVPTNAASGMNLSGTVTNLTIQGFKIVASGTSTVALQMQDFTSDSSGITISKNHITGSGAGNIGIEFAPASGTVSNNILNGFANNAALHVSQSANTTPSAITVNIYNNTLYNNLTGILVADDQVSKKPTVNIQNNIVSNNTTGISRASSDVTVNSSYNNVVSNGTNFSGISAGSNAIALSPSYASTTSGQENFHLLASSPSIDVGTTIASITDDIEGNPRPYGLAYDQGAYENDNIAPTISNQSPLSAATSVSASTNISFRLTDSDTGINTSTITLSVNGTSVTPTLTAVSAPNTYDVTYDPASDFSAGSTVTVAVTANDLASTANTLSTSWSFTVFGSSSGGSGPAGGSSSKPTSNIEKPQVDVIDEAVSDVTQDEDSQTPAENTEENVSQTSSLENKPNITSPVSVSDVFDASIDATEEEPRTDCSDSDNFDLQDAQKLYRTVGKSVISDNVFVYTSLAEIAYKLSEQSGITVQVKSDVSGLKTSFRTLQGATLEDTLNYLVNKKSGISWAVSGDIIIIASTEYFDTHYYKTVDFSISDSVKLDCPWIRVITSYKAECGNGITPEAEEACDDGNTSDGDGCSSSCQVEEDTSQNTTNNIPQCGNNLLESPEACDDGNTSDGDGCSSSCQTENTSQPPDENQEDDNDNEDQGDSTDNTSDDQTNQAGGGNTDSDNQGSDGDQNQTSDTQEDVSDIGTSDENQDGSQSSEPESGSQDVSFENAEDDAQINETDSGSQDVSSETVVATVSDETLKDALSSLAGSTSPDETGSLNESESSLAGGSSDSSDITTHGSAETSSGSQITSLSTEESIETSSCALDNGSLDSDKDGLSDRAESLLRSNCQSQDTDSDGISDSDEFLIYNTDLTDPNSFVKFQAGTYITPYISNIHNGDVFAQNTPLFRGISNPGIPVTLYLVNESSDRFALGTQEVAQNGKFLLETITPLQDGIYLAYLEQILPEGTLLVSERISFSINTSLDISAPKLLSLSGQKISDEVLTGKRRMRITLHPELLGKIDFNSIIVVDWQSAVFASAVIADSIDGSFFATAPSDLELGNHTAWAYAIRPEDQVRSSDVKIQFTLSKDSLSPFETFAPFLTILFFIGSILFFRAHFREAPSSKNSRKND